jgi:hypothetical protein
MGGVIGMPGHWVEAELVQGCGAWATASVVELSIGVGIQ